MSSNSLAASRRTFRPAKVMARPYAPAGLPGAPPGGRRGLRWPRERPASSGQISLKGSLHNNLQNSKRYELIIHGCVAAGQKGAITKGDMWAAPACKYISIALFELPGGRCRGSEVT